MNKAVKFFTLALLLIITTTANFGQDEMSQNEKMNAWMEYMTPADMH